MKVGVGDTAVLPSAAGKASSQQIRIPFDGDAARAQGTAASLRRRTSSIHPLDEDKPLRRLETDVVEKPKQLEILVRDNGLDSLNAQFVKI